MDSLRSKVVVRKIATSQLVYDILIHLADEQNLLVMPTDKTYVEHQQMRELFTETPHAKRYGRVCMMRVRLVDTCGVAYPQG